jgi:hypothetical protein
MTERTYNVVFLCTGNSARSILAEGILRKDGGLECPGGRIDCRGTTQRSGCGCHRTRLVHKFDLLKRKRHVALADAQEAAGADDHGLNFATAFHEQFTDVAILLVVLVVNIQPLDFRGSPLPRLLVSYPVAGVHLSA